MGFSIFHIELNIDQKLYFLNVSACSGAFRIYEEATALNDRLHEWDIDFFNMIQARGWLAG
jgi:hypothetical protein